MNRRGQGLAGSPEVDDHLEIRQAPLHEVLLNLFHGNPFRLQQLHGGQQFLGGAVEPHTGAAPQLLGPQGRDVNEEEAAFDGGRLGVNNGRVIGRRGGFLPLRVFIL